MQTKQINSWADLQASISDIVKKLNKDENLKLAAASNPLLALKELGYEINEEILGRVEDRIRFKTRQIATLSKLRSIIHGLAGRLINIRSQADLNVLVFEELKLEVYDDRGCLVKKEIRIKERGEASDDLEVYRDQHPIIDKLIEFRKLDATVAGFCDEATYRKIRTGKFGKNSNIKLSVKIKEN